MGISDPARVEGYAGRLSYAPGEVATLHLSVTRPGVLGDVVPGDGPQRCDVTVLRDGARPEVVWRADGVIVDAHPVPADASGAGARWPVTVEVPIGDGWRSGFHVVELRSRDVGAPEGGVSVGDDPEGGASDRVAHAGFVVRPRPGAPTSPVLLALATNTWNAYNDWGGTNLYTGGTHVSFARPFARGYVVRPDAAANRNANLGPRPDPDVAKWIAYVFGADVSPWCGCAGWPGWERPFVAWAESVGHQVEVCTNADLVDHPELLDDHPLLLSVGHDEYWTWAMRDAVDAHVAAGGNVAFLSGNTAFWQVRLEDGGDTMVAYKMSARTDDPVVGTADEHLLTSMWSDPRTGRPESAMTGVSFTRGGYARIGAATPRATGGYTVWRPEHWLLEGTDLRYGDQLGAADTIVGYECDGCALTLVDGRPVPTHEDGCPPGFEVVATAPAHLWSKVGDVDDYPEGLSALRAIGELEEVADLLFGDHEPATTARLAYGHAVLGARRDPVGGGTVVTTGCTDWVFGLVGGDPAVERITTTVLDRLASWVRP